MANLAQINQTLEDSISLKLVAQAYSEIAALRLQKIRTGIQKNRLFFQEIIQVFRAVKMAAMQRNIKEGIKQKKALSILITSNHRFYGNIENRLTQYFMENTRGQDTERLIIGKTALDALNTLSVPFSYNSLIFQDDLPNMEETMRLVQNLAGYQQILVYYSRMHTVLDQEPHVVDILQKPPEIYLQSPEHTFQYIFEPDLDKMLQFFDSQITALVLEQTLLESELARTASRLISMEQAQTNADGLIKKQRTQLLEAKRSTTHFHLLDTLAALRSLKKERYGI